VRPFLRAAAVGAAGVGLLVLGWPFTAGAAPALAFAAASSLVAVWRWERTRIVVTTEMLLLVSGALRRRTRAVPLARIGVVEVEQTLAGRLLGYGTLVAGELEIAYVPKPRHVYGLVERVCAS
jgi:membrane protein YdbS with pleckstrin-like domain